MSQRKHEFYVKKFRELLTKYMACNVSLATVVELAGVL